MTNKEKFLALVSKERTNTLEKNRERIRNREMLRGWQQIAMKVLGRLDELEWTNKTLSEALHISPQDLAKILSGKENLTMEMKIKLQNLLDVSIIE